MAKEESIMKNSEIGEKRTDEFHESVEKVVRHTNDRVRVVARNNGLTSKTDQGHKANCDMNNIVNRYARTGIPPTSKGPGQHVDVTALQGDLTEVIQRAGEIAETAEQVKKNYLKKQQELADAQKNGSGSNNSDSSNSDKQVPKAPEGEGRKTPPKG
jgi:hypothetical protein